MRTTTKGIHGHTTRNFVFCNLSYATKKSHMQLFWSCMQHVQLHATFFSCIRQVAKDKISSSGIIALIVVMFVSLLFLVHVRQIITNFLA
jgi:hypothetical protein